MARKPVGDRRSFLQGAALGGVAAMAAPIAQRASAQPSAAAPVARSTPAIPRSEGEKGPPPALGPKQANCGSDFMVDVLRGLGIEYFSAVAGNTFKGLHESVINYGMLSAPALTHITCTHEEISVAMAHGYAKVEGKPLACMMHSTVGLQHGSMALYNAWCDRAPIFAMVGGLGDQARRFTKVEWLHSAVDDAALVRDFTKWSDQPRSLQAFTESAARAYNFAMTPPYGPVLLTVDGDLQEDPYPPNGRPEIVAPPQRSVARANDAAITETARLLVAADNPILLVDRVARTAEGVRRLVELAELLQCAVNDQGGRMNFPWRHPLAQTQGGPGLVRQADVIVGMEMTDLWSFTHGRTGGREGPVRRTTQPGAKVVSISSVDLLMGSNYGDFNRFSDPDIQIAADAEASLPALIEACKAQITEARRSAFAARGAKLAAAHKASLQNSLNLAASGWTDSPITVARMCAEIYEALRGEDFTLASGTDFQSKWPQQLWSIDKHHQYIGDSGAYGIGYTAPGTLGAALANRKHGRITVSINGDGDLMFCNGVLWTAAHDNIPILYVVHNNRAWHQELMFLEQTAAQRDRGLDRTHIGTTLTNPQINFSMLAKSMGVYAEGPIDNPHDLGPALKRAIAVVKKGEPALLDVISQPR